MSLRFFFRGILAYINSPKGVPLKVPRGFHRSTINGHSFFCCSKSIIVSGVELFCIHKVRTDQFKPSKLIHICEYKAKNKKELVDAVQQNFIDTLYDYVSEKNLSIRTATSKIFRSLLKIVYQFAQKHPDISFEQFFPAIGRGRFTEQFIGKVQAIKQIRLQKYSEAKDASLLLDAGSINGTPYRYKKRYIHHFTNSCS